MEHLIGKSMIASITFRDRNGDVVEYFQTDGRVVNVGEDIGIVIEKSDGSGHFGWPPNIDWLQRAAPGTYRLRGTGQAIVDPDFLGSVTLSDLAPENLAQYKAHGFGNFESRD